MRMGPLQASPRFPSPLGRRCRVLHGDVRVRASQCAPDRARLTCAPAVRSCHAPAHVLPPSSQFCTPHDAPHPYLTPTLPLPHPYLIPTSSRPPPCRPRASPPTSLPPTPSLHHSLGAPHDAHHPYSAPPHPLRRQSRTQCADTADVCAGKRRGDESTIANCCPAAILQVSSY